MQIDAIYEHKRVTAFLKTRGLLLQYKKCKNYLLTENTKNTNLKLRKPKELGIYYFRINKQFRALCTIKNNELRVFKKD